MASLFTKNFGIVNARNFESFLTGNFAQMYITIGRGRQWPNSDTIVTPVDTANTFYDFWNNLIGIKKITASDMNLVIPRVDWAANTKYIEYTQDTQLFIKGNTSNIAYDNKFYVRNTKDQIFKCLFNNANANSTIMPEIAIDGQLPENAFIDTSDGYKWKYMYTIPAGLKEKFFTSQFMPVTSESIVTNNAVDGRLDILKIITAGAGFNANANSNSLAIFTVTGDGSNANITARITTTPNTANGGNIVNYNIISGGNNYTRATITIVDAIKIPGTANGNVIAVIGPPGGHGSDVAQELGASALMVSVGIEGDESGVIPVSVTGNEGFRQIGLLKDPLLAAASNVATGTVYRATTKYRLTEPSKDYEHQEVVYISEGGLSSATLTASVEFYDGANNEIYVNNIVGTVNPPQTLIGDTSGAIATIVSIEESDLKRYSGDLLYIENTAEISRDPTETQQIKLTLRF